MGKPDELNGIESSEELVHYILTQIDEIGTDFSKEKLMQIRTIIDRLSAQPHMGAPAESALTVYSKATQADREVIDKVMPIIIAALMLPPKH